MVIAPGTIIANRYRVVRPIAEGGMGAVYEVAHAATDARRALKIMHGEIAHDERQRTRFIQEARVGATIQSDHVAKVLDAGVDEATGTLFIVMDLLDGRTLSQEIRRRGTLTLREANEVMRQTCHAVAAAHRMGIIHRDLKPSNIFLSIPQSVGMDFMVRVLDFGIAKAAAEANAGATAVVGTPTWMAPEQTDPHGALGPATDVWPLGLIAFRMLTGFHYFPSGNVEGASTAAMLRDAVLEPLIAASARAAMYGVAKHLPPAFDAWFARCVCRDPALRFATAAETYTSFAEMAAPQLGAGLPAGGATPSAPSFGDGASEAATWAPSNAGASERGTAVEISSPWGTDPSNSQQPGFTGVKPTAAPARAPRRAWVLVAALLGAAAIGVIAFVLATRANSGTTATTAESAGASSVASAPASVPPPASATRADLRLHGSNTIGEELGPALVEAFLKRRAGVSSVAHQPLGDAEMRLEAHPEKGTPLVVELQARGSATGFQDLESGAADVAMSSRRIKPDEAKRLARLGDMTSAACEHVIALDGVAIVVNPKNPVSKLGREQLAKIFAGETARWSEAGGRDAAISVLARDEQSGTFDLVKTLILGARVLAPGAARFESSDKLSDAVAEDANAIGFVGVGAVRSAKAVMVEAGGAVALLPSAATVATEDYLLTRRLYLYAPSRATELTRAFIDFVLTDEGQQVVATSGFVDLRPTCEPPTRACEHCPREYMEAIQGACRVSATVRLDATNGQLDTRALRDLQRIAGMMRKPENAAKGIVVVGFAEPGATKDGALARSLGYAEDVAAQLRARGLQVHAVKGFGSSMSVADEVERNRRVEVWLR